MRRFADQWATQLIKDMNCHQLGAAEPARAALAGVGG
jgi:hypothetical protein